MTHRYSPGSSSTRKVTQLNPEMTAVAARTRWRNASERYEAVTVNDDCSSASLHLAPASARDLELDGETQVGA